MKLTAKTLWIISGSIICIILGAIIGIGPQEIYLRLSSAKKIQQKVEKLKPLPLSSTALEKQPQQVVEILKSFLQQNPQSAIALRARLQLAKAYYKSSSIPQAHKTIRQLSITSDTGRLLYFNWAQFLYTEGQIELTHDYLKLLENVSFVGSPQVLLLLGKVENRLGNQAGAYKHWEYLRHHYPNTTAAQKAYADWIWAKYRLAMRIKEDERLQGARELYLSGRHREAQQLLEGQNSPKAIYCLFEIARDLGDDEAIESLALHFLELFPQNPLAEKVVFQLAQSLKSQKSRRHDAIYYYRQFLQRFPKSSRTAIVFLDLGDCYVALGKNEKARETYLQITHLKARESILQIAYYSAAYTYIRTQQNDLAIPLLQKAATYSGRLTAKINKKLLELNKK